MTPTQIEIERVLAELAEINPDGHRGVTEALVAIQSYGEKAALAWIRACKALLLDDSYSGNVFIRMSAAAAAASGAVEPWVEQALRFRQWRGASRALNGFMTQLVSAYQLFGPQGEWRWAELGFGWCERHLDSGAAYFGTSVHQLTGGLGFSGIEQILAPAEDLFADRRLPLAAYLHGAIRVRNLLGAQAISPWVKRGADILQSERLRGEAYFRLESEDSLRLLLENLPGYHLPEHQRLLQMLLAAWYREPVFLKEGNWTPERGRAFVESDGKSLFLPGAMPDREEAIVAVLHSAGHIVFGSFDREHIESLFRLAGVENLSLDEEQVSWNPLFDHYGEDRLGFQLLFDICEDLRVDWRINQFIPNHLKRMARLAETQGRAGGSAAAYYDFALQTLKFALGTGQNPPVSPFKKGGRRGDLFEKGGRKGDLVGENDVNGLLNLVAPLLDENATLVDAFRIANELYEHTSLPPVSTLQELHDAFLPGRSPNAARPVYPSERRVGQGAGQYGSGDFDQVLFGDPDFNVSMQESAAFAASAGAKSGQQARAEGRLFVAEAEEKGFPYPEWDYRDKRYKRNWTWVQERTLSDLNLSEAIRLESVYTDAVTRLKRAIQAQKPTRLAPRRRQFEGEEIDLDATVGFVVEKHAGMAPKATLYRRRQVQKRDTAVTLLADLSTSVMSQLPDGQGKVMDRIRAGILLFAESLEEVGDAYSISGFSSKYRDNVSFFKIKGFNEPFTNDVKAIIGGLSGRLATRMGAAIRHAVARFDAAPNRRRLLLLLSDGRPEDYDDGGDRRYLHEDTRMAVKEAADQGVHAFCITLDPTGSEYLPQIFGKGHYLVLDEINNLPNKLPEIYLRLRR